MILFVVKKKNCNFASQFGDDGLIIVNYHSVHCLLYFQSKNLTITVILLKDDSVPHIGKGAFCMCTVVAFSHSLSPVMLFH